MRRAALAAVLLLAGCATPISGSPTGPTPPPPPTTERPPPRQLVFSAQTAGGFVTYDYYASSRPSVVIFADGDAYRAVDRARYRVGQPVELERGTVPRAVLARLIDDAWRSGLFAGRRDLGSPSVTDMPSTGVTFRPGTAPARRVSAYALGYTEADGRLTDAQRDGRRALRSMIRAFTAAVTEPAQWTPDRIDVTEVEGDRTGRAQAWPGPPLRTVLRPASRARCGEVSGAAAGRVFAAALRADGPLWRDGGAVHPLVIRALLPGERACAR